MQQLGNGLCAADHHEDALSVREAELATKRALAYLKKICSARSNDNDHLYKAWTF